MGILSDWQIERDIKIEPFIKDQQSKGIVSFGMSSYGLDLRCGYRFRVFTPVHCTEVDPKNFDPKSFVEVDLTPEEHLWKHDRDDGVFECTKCKATSLNHPNNSQCLSKPNFIRIPPNSFALTESIEVLEIPRDVTGLIVDKSTYRRCGIVMGATVLEAGWKGRVTLEISNSTPLPARIYAGEGLCQVLFFRTDGHNEAVLNAARRLCGQEAQNVLEGGYGPSQARNLRTIEELLYKELGKGSCRVSYDQRKGRYQNQKGIVLPFVNQPETQGVSDAKPNDGDVRGVDLRDGPKNDPSS